MNAFDAAIALTVGASTGFGAMLGYGWLYPKYWQAERDLDHYYSAQGEWLSAIEHERAKQLGFSTRNDDEADAIGILDYAIESLGHVPVWRANEVLRPPLVRACA